MARCGAASGIAFRASLELQCCTQRSVIQWVLPLTRVHKTFSFRHSAQYVVAQDSNYRALKKYAAAPRASLRSRAECKEVLVESLVRWLGTQVDG